MLASKKVRIFTIEQQFPCDCNSTCCGPTGQSEQEIMALKIAIEKLAIEVEVYDIKKIKNVNNYPEFLSCLRRLVRSSPYNYYRRGDCLCWKSDINETISAIKEKL